LISLEMAEMVIARIGATMGAPEHGCQPGNQKQWLPTAARIVSSHRKW
jgi:hypothetical protein